MKKEVLAYRGGIDSASVYCGTYKKYSEGSLEGMWIDLEMFTDADEFFEVCRKLHDDESDPEFMFQDFQGFPEELYHESMSAEGVQKILDWLQLDDEREMLEGYIEVVGGSVDNFGEMLDDARDRSCGKWDSFREFADEQAQDEIAQLSQNGVTDFFERYFDYESYARDLEYDYYTASNGYIFRAA